MLWEISNLNTYPSFRSVRFPNLMSKYLLKFRAAMLVYLQGTPTWRPENSVDI